MATRPIFIGASDGAAFVRVEPIEFVWHAGMAKARRQMSVRSLHAAGRALMPGLRLLEASRMSENPLGEQLSAFNLTFARPKSGREITVECAFQASKVFENGGPYLDLLDATPLDAKRDPRLLASGNLTGFRFDAQDWASEPKTAFYDWLYINALHRKPRLAAAVMEYDAFTDIVFNPERSFNCQAGAIALYVALRRRGLLDKALESRDTYLAMMSDARIAGPPAIAAAQGRLL